MAADIIPFPEPTHRPGNGALEMMAEMRCFADPSYILAAFWERGFKVVPLDNFDRDGTLPPSWPEPAA